MDFKIKHCDEHKEENKVQVKEYDKYRFDREPHVRRFYNSKSWRNLRNSVMMDHDWICANCKRDDMLTAAKIVDHIIEIKDDWDKRLDASNLEPLCHDCHNKKTADERKKREGR